MRRLLPLPAWLTASALWGASPPISSTPRAPLPPRLLPTPLVPIWRRHVTLAPPFSWPTLATLAALAALPGCDRGGVDPRTLSSLAAPAAEDPGFLLQSSTGAAAGQPCAHDQQCARPLRCIDQACTIPPSIRGAASPQTPTLSLGIGDGSDVTVSLELADDPFEHQQGLMWRTRMAPNWGMLFIFPSSRPRSFWMKNTYIPLDILYIREDGLILNIARRTTPHQTSPSYPSDGDARYVLELNGGFCDTNKINPGQRVVFSGVPGAPASP
jgi:uncharacterized protein